MKKSLELQQLLLLLLLPWLTWTASPASDAITAATATAAAARDEHGQLLEPSEPLALKSFGKITGPMRNRTRSGGNAQRHSSSSSYASSSSSSSSSLGSSKSSPARYGNGAGSGRHWQDIYIAGFFALSGDEFEASVGQGVMPAVELALQHVAATNYLHDHRLQLLHNNTQVNIRLAAAVTRLDWAGLAMDELVANRTLVGYICLDVLGAGASPFNGSVYWLRQDGAVRPGFSTQRPHQTLALSPRRMETSSRQGMRQDVM